ncbi:TrpB-like pyridoxal phosphate-dependent enzyme [candidate division KSB1 bacterium]|nr:TrpB-like pyridoxal phosphate-dependent enzyme [candidate division KSB1 bacterium]
MQRTKIILEEKDMPQQWYNILPDMPTPMLPPLHPGTKQPIGPEDLAPLFPMELIKQEVSQDRWIDIPDEVQDILKLWRPAPLYRARRLEKLLDTPAKIYFKNEGVSPAGSHKPNTAIAQAYYNKEAGIKKITTETGAGQWGSALSLACNFFGIDCKVYMVKVSYQQKPYRRSMIMTWGAKVVPSPSDETEAGRAILSVNPDSPGSLGIAISEAVEVAAKNEDTKYSLGSVLNHVMLHQTVIGQEAKKQMEIAGDYPDIVIGCCGGGSNFAGLAFPFLKDKFEGKKMRVIAVEPSSCPTLTRGPFAYDFGDTAQTTPLIAMYTLGHTFIPPGIHAGGLRYHGMAPTVSHLLKHKQIEAQAYDQLEVFDAAQMFARAEGFIPAPETSHAIKATIVEALKAKQEGTAKTILFNFSGHGHFDMGAYDAYMANKLENYPLPDEDIQSAIDLIKDYPKAE